MSALLTFTSHALVNEPVQQGATMIAECWTGVRMDLKLVFTAWVLKRETKSNQPLNTKQYSISFIPSVINSNHCFLFWVVMDPEQIPAAS